jgi:uncharacterized protein (DUF1697 family)
MCSSGTKWKAIRTASGAEPAMPRKSGGSQGSPRTRRRYVAFLRGINVGGHVVRMEQLRKLFGEMGFSEVETFIASGNVIFSTLETDASALERRIETKLQQALGYAVATFVRSIDAVQGIARHQPFPPDRPGDEKSTVYVILLVRVPTPAARRQLAAFESDTDAFAVKGREIYWHRRGSLLESPFSGARLGGTDDTSATMRNRNTLVRLAAKYALKS